MFPAWHALWLWKLGRRMNVPSLACTMILQTRQKPECSQLGMHYDYGNLAGAWMFPAWHALWFCKLGRSLSVPSLACTMILQTRQKPECSQLGMHYDYGNLAGAWMFPAWHALWFCKLGRSLSVPSLACTMILQTRQKPECFQLGMHYDSAN